MSSLNEGGVNLEAWYWQLDGGHGGWHPLRNVLQRTYRIWCWRKWKGRSLCTRPVWLLVLKSSKRARMFCWRARVSGRGGACWADLGGSSNKLFVYRMRVSTYCMVEWTDCVYGDVLRVMCFPPVRRLEYDGWAFLGGGVT